MSRYVRRIIAGAGRDFLSGLVATSHALWHLSKDGASRLFALIERMRKRLMYGRPNAPEKMDNKPARTEKNDQHPISAVKIAAGRALAKRQVGRRWKIIGGAVSAGLFLVAGLVWANLLFAETILPEDEVDLWTINRPTSLTFLDRNDEVIGQRGIRYADPVPLEELPPYLIDAFISTEDRRFFSHRGYDTKALTRALLANMRAGTVVEGGSTITQQLAKNLFLDPDRTLSRKIEELQYALWLEARLSKDEILSLYLNRIYLGGGAYGVEAAAQAYFSKSARDLTLPEAAVIAGLPKAPSLLSPTTNPEGAIARSREVIDNLRETRKISREAAEAAKATPPELHLATPPSAYGYYLDYVAGRIAARLGELHDDIVVKTTFDPVLQGYAEAAIRAGIDEAAKERGAEQAALVVFDDQGGIVAMAGGLDYEKSQFNRAAQAMRQPGSAFKPFVYLAAMEAGLSPNSLVIDRPIKVGDWEPGNYSGKYRGPMRVSTAVALSINSVAVQVTETIGRDRVIDAARRAGISQDLKSLPSIALGTLELPLVELTAAYMPFAHHGAERPAHAVMEIRTRQGEELYRYEPIEGYSVIEPAMADETAQLLMAVMQHGTGREGRFGNHHLAGKTGTTDDWRDAWFIGFSSYYTAGVWVGNDRNEPMARVSGSTIPLSIWKEFMVNAHKDLPPKPLLKDEETPSLSVRTTAGVYASLRSDLVSAAYPIPDVDWDVIEGDQREERPRRRGLFGLIGRDGTRDEPPQNRGRATVVGNAAPGLEVTPEEPDGQP